MRPLEDILANPKKRKKYGFDHSSTHLLLKISRDERTPEVEAVLVERHQRLAHSVASSLWRKYRNRLGGVIDFDDVLGAAMHGLLISVRRFDARYANEFSTYAIHWIRQVAAREIVNNLGMAHIPVNFQKRLNSMYLRKNEGTDNLALLVDFRLMHKVSLDNYAGEDTELIQLLPSSCSLNQPSLDGNDLPEIQLLQQDLRRRIEESISALLDERRGEMVKMRYGFGKYGRPHTLEEVGKYFSVTRERVRQIAKRYIEKVVAKRVFDKDELAVFRRVS
ncbi:MAG TPA: sigma-70 family RNA polymerase sigma factor [Rectinemataceae bacterium]|nr:sigma-70 family RNA polymerase sigma factor [Rectinemataceae bacterium]